MEGMPMDIEKSRFNMIEQQIRPWDVLDTDVLDLLAVVKREHYVPEAYRALAFVDMEIPLAGGQNIGLVLLQQGGQIKDSFGGAKNALAALGSLLTPTALAVGTLAGGDALIGLRSRGDTNRPFTLVQAMQSDAEAKFRQTEQGLTKHLEEVEKKLRTLRSGGGEGAE
jgi:hypothetical protein